MKNYERFPLYIYNSISRKKEKFVAIHEPHVGMYVCGPTVYNDVHIGNCRTFVSFDIMFRYMKYLDYKVRYVRNITDRKSTRLNSSHVAISYAVFCLKK